MAQNSSTISDVFLSIALITVIAAFCGLCLIECSGPPAAEFDGFNRIDQGDRFEQRLPE